MRPPNCSGGNQAARGKPRANTIQSPNTPRRQPRQGSIMISQILSLYSLDFVTWSVIQYSPALALLLSPGLRGSSKQLICLKESSISDSLYLYYYTADILSSSHEAVAIGSCSFRLPPAVLQPQTPLTTSPAPTATSLEGFSHPAVGTGGIVDIWTDEVHHPVPPRTMMAGCYCIYATSVSQGTHVYITIIILTTRTKYINPGWLGSWIHTVTRASVHHHDGSACAIIGARHTVTVTAASRQGTTANRRGCKPGPKIQTPAPTPPGTSVGGSAQVRGVCPKQQAVDLQQARRAGRPEGGKPDDDARKTHH